MTRMKLLQTVFLLLAVPVIGVGFLLTHAGKTRRSGVDSQIASDVGQSENTPTSQRSPKTHPGPVADKREDSGELRGLVTATDGTGIQGALVKLSSTSGEVGRMVFLTEISDSAGRFHTKNLPAGRYRVEVSHSKYPKKLAESDVQDARISDLRIVLESGGGLRISCEPATRAPEFIAIVVSSGTCERVGQYWEGQTIEGLAVGSKQIALIPLSPEFGVSQAVATIEPDRITELVVTLTPGLGATGIIIDPDERPVSGIEIEVVSDLSHIYSFLTNGSPSSFSNSGTQWSIEGSPPRLTYRARTDSEGRFSLPAAICTRGPVECKLFDKGRMIATSMPSPGQAENKIVLKSR